MINDPILIHDWYPLVRSSDLPEGKVIAGRLLGEDLVLWRVGGQPQAWQDLCIHRGTRLSLGSVEGDLLKCPYHGWSYGNDGRLEHVPGTTEAYYDALDKPSLGLVQARVDTYAGIVFATWAEDAPSLEAFLGDARWYLDTVFNRRDGGMQALGPMKWLKMLAACWVLTLMRSCAFLPRKASTWIRSWRPSSRASRRLSMRTMLLYARWSLTRTMTLTRVSSPTCASSKARSNPRMCYISSPPVRLCVPLKLAFSPLA